MLDLVKAVCPNFPENKEVRETANFERFFKVISGVLYVPNMKITRGNFILTNKYIEAVNAFAAVEIGSSTYLWDDLVTTEVSNNIQAASMSRFLMAQKKLAIDIETCHTGYDNNRMLLIGFAYDDNHSIVFQDTVDLKYIKCILENPNITLIWQNGKFDTSRLQYWYGIKSRIDEDTMLQHYIGINERKGTHSLKDLGPLYLQAPQWDDELKEYKAKWCREHKVKLADFTYDMIPKEILIPYLHRDCIATFRLHNLFNKLMRPGSISIYRNTIRAANVFRDIELAGNTIDRNYWYELEDKLDTFIVNAEREITRTANIDWDSLEYIKDTGAKSFCATFNHRSPKQLKWLLEKLTGEKLPSSDAKVLDKLSATYPDIPFIKAIQELRKWNIYMNTFVFGVDRALCKDGKVHCTFNLHGTETGRLSCTEPNMQNVPRNKLIKNLFIAPKGYKMVQLDYSQAELRTLAYLSQDKYLKEVYLEGKDLHSAMALKIFGEGFTKEQRVAAKTINFGIPYGRGPGTIATQLSISYSDASKMISDWFKAAPGAKRFVDAMRKEPFKTTGEPYTTIFGRQRHYIITNENRHNIQNEAINFPVSSIAADLTTMSVCDIHDWLLEEKIDAFITNTVHDSIIIAVKDEPQIIAKVIAQGKYIMAHNPIKYLPELDFPFKADADVGYSWGNLKEPEEEVPNEDN